MIINIENEFLTAEVNTFGAELYSLKSKKTETEYLWQGNPEYWKSRSTVLFPICGRLFEGKYVYNGKEYEMPLHGIAKLFEFKAEKVSENQAVFTLTANEETLGYYPFDFEFSVSYVLKKNIIEVSYKVKNNGEVEMPFSYGAHPGFNVPFNSDGNFEDYYVEFTKDCMDRLIMSERCLYLNKTEKYPLNDKKMHLKHNLFDDDAIFLVSNTDKVALKSSKHDNYVEVFYKNMTCVGFWHKPKTDAPFVCIEPWHGIPADDGVTDDFMTKRNILKLKSKDAYLTSYEIKISEK